MNGGLGEVADTLRSARRLVALYGRHKETVYRALLKLPEGHVTGALRETDRTLERIDQAIAFLEEEQCRPDFMGEALNSGRGVYVP